MISPNDTLLYINQAWLNDLSVLYKEKESLQTQLHTQQTIVNIPETKQ